jgi:GWxTD domain-containing protein
MRHGARNLKPSATSLRRRGAGLLLGLALAFGSGCHPSAKPVLDPESRTFYETARLIMTGEEQKIFSRLPDATARKEFIRDFWDKRDPDPETPVNEFKQEFERRIDYANRRFLEGRPGWKTDRGRIYIYMGAPDKIDESFHHGLPDVRGSLIWWVYYRYQLAIEFADEEGTNDYRIRRYDGHFFDAMDILNLGQAATDRDLFRKRYVDFKLAYDETGRSLVVSLPSEILNIKAEGGSARATLVFEIYLYQAEGEWRDKLRETRPVVLSRDDLSGNKLLTFDFPVALAAGDYYGDVVIRGERGASGKVRKIFEFRVK